MSAPTIQLPGQAQARSAFARLEIGDPLPDFTLPDHAGALVHLYDQTIAGAPVAIFVARGLARAAAQQELAKLAELQPKFSELGARILVVSGDSLEDSATLVAKRNLPFSLLCDAAGEILDILEPNAKGREPIGLTIVADANLRVVKLIGRGGETKQAIAALLALQKLAEAAETTLIHGQAPVLIIPNVLSAEQCQRLIKMWETGNPFEGTVRGSSGRYVDPSFKRRADVVIEEPGMVAEIQAAMAQRVIPEIRKAFQYQVTQHEALRVGCYDSASGGYFRRHRDDSVLETSHRRFAMTMNLNTGQYQGGFLKFPEYGPYLYQPASGGAVIFSCSLLHEAMPVTHGRRFGMFTFLYGDAEARILAARLAAEAAAR